jgi:trigger factor
VKAELKEPTGCRRTFEVEVPSVQVQEAMEELYREYGLKAKIPGFRPGKVPRAILEARFGKGIEAEAIEKLVPESFERALAEHRLVPVNRAQISDLDLSSDRVLRFKATFEVLPKVEIKRYKGIPAVKRLRKVSPSDVDREVDFLRSLYAEFSPAERPSAEGDRVLIDYSPLTEFPGSQKFRGQDYAVDLGAPQVLAEFNRDLAGVRPGDKKEITVQYPDDHPSPEAAGRKIGFRVAVKNVQERKLPSLDDEFARKVSEYQTLAELRDKIQAGLEARAESEAMEQVNLQVMNAIITENPMELPESLVRENLDRMLGEARERHKLSHRHADGATCDQCDLDEEKMSKELRPVAEWRIRQDLFLSHLAALEKIEAGSQEVEAAVRDLARRQRADPAQLMAALEAHPERLEDLRDRIAAAKASEMLGRWAEIKTENID